MVAGFWGAIRLRPSGFGGTSSPSRFCVLTQKSSAHVSAGQVLLSKSDKQYLAICYLPCILPHDCCLTTWQYVDEISLRLSPLPCHVHRSLTPLAFSYHSEIASAPMVGERCSNAGHMCAGPVFGNQRHSRGVSLWPTRANKPISAPGQMVPDRKPKE
jgi:hypothetical protein